MRARRLFLLLSFSLVAGLGLPGVLGQATSARYEGLIVDRVDLSPDGPLSGISEDRLRSLLTLQPGDRYTAIGVKQCLQRLYSSHLFSDIQADVHLLSAGHVALDFRLARIVLIRNVSFSGDKKLDPSELLRETGFHDRDPFDREGLDAALAQLSAFYEKNGFFRRRLRPRLSYVRDLSLVDIDFEIQSGEQARVRTLAFDIEPPANVSALQQEITTQQGRKYSGVVLDQDIQNLSRQFSLLGYLNADVYIKENAYHAEDNSVSVTIRANPRDFVHVDVQGAKLSYRDRWELMPLYSERNTEPVFVQESARNLTQFLQEDGKFLATVRPAIHPDPPHTIIFDTAAGKSLSLAEIRFENTGSVNENDLRAVLALKIASFLSRGVYSSEILAADVDRLRGLYIARGYVNARVAPRMETSGADLIVIFRVLPGPRFRVRSVKLEGNRFFDESRLLSLLQTIPDGVYSPQTVALDRSALINAYLDAGFSNVDFHTDVQFPSLALADVTYNLDEGDRYTIERVVIAGNRTTREEVIRRHLTFAPGEPVSLEKLLTSQSNLYNLGIFNRVTIDPEPTFRDPLQKMLLVRVEEAKRYTLTYGAGYEDADPRVTVGLSDNNNLGSGRTLATALRAGLRHQRGQVSYSIPQPFGLRLPTIVSLFYQHEQKRKGDLQQDLGKPFDTTRMTALLQSERQLSSQTSLFFRYNYERVTVGNIEDIEVLFRENRPVRLSRISASLLNDRRDDALDATRGTFSSVDLQLVPRLLGSEAQFGRLFLQQQYFHSITPGLVVAVSGRFGWLQPFGKNSVDRSLPPELQNPIPISERFFAGGSTSLRGFRLDQAGPLFERTILVNGEPEKRLLPVGGDALLIWNSELRFPILGPLRGAIFYDTGNVFRKVSDISFGDFSHAVGFGVRIRTPFGPVRADLGYNLNPPRNFQKRLFFFTIGQTF